MSIDFFKRLFLMLLLCVVQIFIFNHIQIFGVATPFIYIYLVFRFPANYPQWGILLWSFFTGLVIDIFSNTPGVASAAMTFIGLLQPYMLKAMLQRDAAENFKPSIFTLGPKKYFYYSFILTAIFCLILITLDTFNFFDWATWAMQIGGSTALTLLIILIIESLRKK